MLKKIFGALSALVASAWWLSWETIKAAFFEQVVHAINPMTEALLHYGVPVIFVGACVWIWSPQIRARLVNCFDSERAPMVSHQEVSPSRVPASQAINVVQRTAVYVGGEGSSLKGGRISASGDMSALRIEGKDNSVEVGDMSATQTPRDRVVDVAVSEAHETTTDGIRTTRMPARCHSAQTTPNHFSAIVSGLNIVGLNFCALDDKIIVSGIERLGPRPALDVNAPGKIFEADLHEVPLAFFIDVHQRGDGAIQIRPISYE